MLALCSGMSLANDDDTAVMELVGNGSRDLKGIERTIN